MSNCYCLHHVSQLCCCSTLFILSYMCCCSTLPRLCQGLLACSAGVCLCRGSPVRCLAASPALDVVGVGLSDGRAIVHNLRYDEQVMELHNAAAAGTGASRFLQGSAAAAAAASTNVAVTCLSFRTGALGRQLIVT